MNHCSAMPYSCSRDVFVDGLLWLICILLSRKRARPIKAFLIVVLALDVEGIELYTRVSSAWASTWRTWSPPACTNCSISLISSH